ncbi:MAG: DUF1080 domain-containing protein [Verrucomicrobiae bacterium]|nr:DUF1080 domain-containing protein [Verrucomicrobiae bacterium]
MNSPRFLPLSLSLLPILALAIPAFVKADDDLPEGAKLLVEDPLDESTFKPFWVKAKGKFAIEDGIFTAREIPEEKHHAGAGRIQPIMDGILDVEFRFVESEQLQFGFDYTTDEKKDHLLRAVIDKGTVSARAGSGWGPTTKMKPFGPKPVKVEVPAGEWHQGRIEFRGQEVIISVNGETYFAAAAETPLAGVEKNRIALTARGVAQFRNLKLWSLEGVSDADWGKRFRKAQRAAGGS